MRKAIHTKFLAATNTKGSRVKAFTADQSITRGYEHCLHHSERHCAIAMALVEKMGWHGFYVGGGSADGKGEVFVNVATDGAWKHARGLAEHNRASHDKPYGFEGQDWFYIAGPDSGDGAVSTKLRSE